MEKDPSSLMLLRMTRAGKCHPERSEGSSSGPHLAYAKRSFVADAPQDDSGGKMSS